jgi:hypothetical protein
MKLLNPARYAAVTSTLALVIALGGTSYAALVITGQDIKNNSVTSADVKNGNLKLKDLAASTRDGLTGARGAPGATGPTGPSNGYSDREFGEVALGEGLVTPLISLTLPAGKYLVDFKGTAHNSAASSVIITCSVSYPSGPSDESLATLAPTVPSYATVALKLGVTLAAQTTVSVTCSHDGTDVSVMRSVITALKVATLN